MAGFQLNSRVPVALGLAVIVTGCALGPTSTKPPKGAVSYATKLEKVNSLTRTFSISKNDGLMKVSESFKQLSGALSGAFRSASGLGSAVSAAPLRYQVNSALDELNTAGTEAAYVLAGVEEKGAATVTYDDVTGEVTGIQSADAEVAFKFVNNGRTRTWQATIVRSKDGTTGSFFVEVTGDWSAQPTPAPDCHDTALGQPDASPAPVPSIVASADPIPTASTEPAASAEPAATGAVEPSADPSATAAADPEATGATQAYTLLAATCTPARPSNFKFLGGEYPHSVDTVKAKFELVPQGDPALAIALEGTFDEAESIPFQHFEVPTHWVFKAHVPKVSLDWDSRMHLDLVASTFKGKGKLSVEGPDGIDDFLYDVKLNQAETTGSFALTNVAAKVKLSINATPGNDGEPPIVKANLLSTDDNSQLGKVTMDPKRPRFAVITLKADDSTIDWELYPDNMVGGFKLDLPKP